MKRTAILISVALATLAAPFARAEGSLTDAQLASIQANCQTAQIVLQHVQESDKLTRINRGPRYESLSRLMANFNSRAAQNKLDVPDLITIASEYQKVWDDFRSKYTEYDDLMTSLVQMDCRTQPTAFYDQLASTRSKRQSLAADVVQFDSLLDKYMQGVTDLKQKQGVK